ncbi:MAG: aspartate aminotransferase family protein [Chloroflexota bacterium]
MNSQEILAMDAQYVLHTYGRAAFVLESGQGMHLTDAEGKTYLDFVSGIAVNALGYGDPDILRAIVAQAGTLMHVSNLYCTAPQAQLAKMLVEASFADKVYFCNSGAESVEAAIKFARKWAKVNYGADRSEFVAFSGAFHGRTMGALALTPRPHYQDAFRPLMPGANIVPFNDLAAAEAAITETTCAVVVEPVQGESGVIPAEPAFLAGLRGLCDSRGALLVFDEVQCGLGRTGTLWAHQPYGVTPDIMTLAKPLGGGLPMGATLVAKKVADVMEPGDHASTFAANPVICAAAQVAFGKISNPAFLEHVRWAGSYLQEGLMELQAKHDCIKEVRGRGLIWGVECDLSVSPIIQACQAEGLLVLNAGPQVLRLIPPLVVEREHLDAALATIGKAFAQR